MRAIRGDRIAMIFQEPMSSLNPSLTVGLQIAEPVNLHRKMPWTQAFDSGQAPAGQGAHPRCRQPPADLAAPVLAAACASAP
jgi:ABC-type dipeptide/oligopeptide/nickel transport system ATPase component